MNQVEEPPDSPNIRSAEELQYDAHIKEYFLYHQQKIELARRILHQIFSREHESKCLEAVFEEIRTGIRKLEEGSSYSPGNNGTLRAYEAFKRSTIQRVGNILQGGAGDNLPFSAYPGMRNIALPDYLQTVILPILGLWYERSRITFFSRDGQHIFIHRENEFSI